MQQSIEPTKTLRNQLCRLPEFNRVRKIQHGWECEYTVLMPTEPPKVVSYVATFSEQFQLLNTNELPEILIARYRHPFKDIIVVFKGDNLDQKKIILQVFEGPYLLHSQEMQTFHGPVYTFSYFTSPNPYYEDQKFVYVAERKICDLEEQSKVYKASFGEKLDGRRDPILVILDLRTFLFDIIDVPDYYPMKPSFLNTNTLIMGGYSKQAPKVGITYCLNRPTVILSLDLINKDVKVLSDSSRSARSPIIIGESIFYLCQPLWLSHIDASDVIEYPGNKVLKTNHFEELLAPHVQCQTLTLNPIEECYQKVSSGYTANSGNYELLYVYKDDYRFAVHSTAGSFQKLVCLYKGQEIVLLDNNTRHPTLTFQSQPTLNHGNVPVNELKRSGNKKAIICPHGGPNSVSLDEFIWWVSYLVHSGFDVFKVNYTGSIGYDNIKDLIIGQQEIQDTLKVAQSVKPFYERMFIMGGSHGGFISCTLVGQYPNLFDAAVVMNPVIDLHSMQLASDIYDWPHGQQQQLCPFTAKGLYNLDDSASPLRWADQVTCPILILLGEKDRRVPYFQGLAWARHLLHQKVKVRTHVFPNADHSLDKDPESATQMPLLIVDFLSSI